MRSFYRREATTTICGACAPLRSAPAVKARPGAVDGSLFIYRLMVN
jgi:hypothetical protein